MTPAFVWPVRAEPESEPAPRILLVDDAPESLRLLVAALGGHCELLVATSGAEALECIRREPGLDLVVLDITMPDLNGHEVLAWLREEYPDRRLPVIFVTAIDDEQAQTTGFALGAVDYIVKPFSLAVVRARVQTHVTIRRQAEQLARLALFDGLTGVANRRCFDDRFANEWRRALRSRRPLGLVLFDVDHFKAYNDRYGHPAGDDCLRLLAHFGQEIIRRPGDLIARYGGEEFALLLPETDLTGSYALAERLRRRVEACFGCHDESGCRRLAIAAPVTLSAGCASLVPQRDTAQTELLATADRRLYRAKAGGRNRCIGSDDDDRAGGVA